MQHIILPYCWVCKETDGLNNHHCVPRAYGGENGPQVTLCATHHTFIHTVALKKRSFHEGLVHENTTNPEQRQKLLQLINIIVTARAATKALAKPMVVQHKFNTERARKLRELKTLVGASSIEATLNALVDKVYDQYVQIRK